MTTKVGFAWKEEWNLNEWIPIKMNLDLQNFQKNKLEAITIYFQILGGKTWKRKLRGANI